MATRNMEPRNDSNSRKADNRQADSNAHLDNRYGRIGIPAVAAAVRCKGEKGQQARKHDNAGTGQRTPYESD